jgi:outer membrane lipoprotein-sorting protein
MNLAPRVARVVNIAFFFAAVPTLSAQNTYTLDQVFAKMDAVARTFRSVQADTERTHVTVLVNDKDVSSGKFYYVRQGKQPRVRLDLLKPSVQQLLIDKGRLQLYTPNLKQVQELSLGEHQDLVELIMALGFGQSSQDLKNNYSISLGADEVIDGRKTTKLELTPKNSKMFKSVQMWMDQDKLVAVQIRTTEAGGDYLVVKFSNIKLNSGISDSVFNLKLPKDVQIVKR